MIQLSRPPENTLPWRRRTLPLSGTLVEISAPAADDLQWHRWTDAVFAALSTFHDAMSFHAAGSDLRMITRARARVGDVLDPRPAAWRTFRLALELA